MRRIGVVLAAFLITQPLGAQEPSVVDEEIQNPVDFGRVDKDIDEATSGGFRESIRLPGADQLGEFKAAVPVLIPMELFTALRDGSTEMAGGEVGLESADKSAGISFSKSGYSAWVPYPEYNLSLQASSVAYAAKNDSSSDFSGIKPDYYSGLTGNTLTFGYAGADYLLLFECRVGGAICITSAEAATLVDNFVLCDQVGDCTGIFPVNREVRP